MRRTLAAVAVLLLIAACSTNSHRVTEGRRERDAAANRDFTDWSNITNNMMVEKYGPPDRVETSRLVWEGRGPWKRIVVWDELGFFDQSPTGKNIEGTIVYPVPEDKVDALLSFSSALRISADGGELSARSKSEERNILMLNLADDIVKGRLTPEAARVSYLRTLHLADMGKSPPSMLRLLFQ